LPLCCNALERLFFFGFCQRLHTLLCTMQEQQNKATRRPKTVTDL
jgi:hypothetical protein